MSSADFGQLDLAALCAATGYAEFAQALTGLLSTDRYLLVCGDRPTPFDGVWLVTGSPGRGPEAGR